MAVLDYFTVTSNGVGAIGVDFIDLDFDPDEHVVYAFVDFEPRLPAGTVIWAPTLTPPRGIQLDTIQARFAPEDGKLRTIEAEPTNEKQRVTITGSPTGGTFTLTYAGQTTTGIAYNANPATVQAALEALSNIAVGDVFVSGVLSNEKQTVTVNGGPTGGKFVLTFNGASTTPIPFNANQSTVKSALNALSTTFNSCSVTGPVGGPWVVDFGGALAGTNVAQMTSAPRGETQTVTLKGDPTGGDFALTFSGQTTAPIAYNASTSAFQSALEALSNIAPGDVTVTGNPGAWVVAFAGAYANQNVAQLIPVSRNEVQAINFTGSPTGGTFTLTWNGQTTTPIYRYEFSQTVANRLLELANIGPGEVAVIGGIGGPWTVTFQNGLGRQNVPLMTATSSLTPSGSAVPAIVSEGIGLTGGTNPIVSVETTIESALLTGGSSPSISVTTTTPGTTGTPFTISFIGALADTDVAPLTASGAGLTPSGGVTITTLTTGGSQLGVKLVANTTVISVPLAALGVSTLIYDVIFTIPETGRILNPFAISANVAAGTTVDLATVTKLPPKDPGT